MKVNSCPFCGSKKAEISYVSEAADVLAMVCDKCGACGPVIFLSGVRKDFPVPEDGIDADEVERQVIRKWNQRYKEKKSK